MNVKVGPWRRLIAKEMRLFKCGVGEELVLNVPWIARRLHQSILKETNPEYSLEGSMLTLKLQYFGHLMQRSTHWKRPWCWERLKAGGERDHKGWDGWMASLTQWTWVWIGSGRWWRTEKSRVLQSMGSQRVRQDWATEQQLHLQIWDWILSCQHILVLHNSVHRI